MTRLLFIHQPADLYGASRVLLRLVTRLDASKYCAHVVLPEDGPLAKALREASVSVTVMPGLRPITRSTFLSWRLLLFLASLPITVLRLARLIRRERIDVVHTNVAPVIAAGLAARITRVGHVWCLREFFHEFPRAWQLYSRYMLWASDVIPCVSLAVARQFTPGTRKVRVIHDGLPVEEFEGISAARIDVFKRRHGLVGHRLVGVVGRIKFKRKGQEMLVQAAALLRDRYPDVRFVIIGSPFPGNEAHLVRLKALIAAVGVSDRVVLTGDAHDIKAAFKSLDVSVLPSMDPEPFGGVVLESMQLGVPVVATRIGGTTEQVEDGTSGLLVPPGDPQAIADAIAALLDDCELRESIRRSATERVNRLFSFDRMAGQLIGSYDDALVRRPRRALLQFKLRGAP